MSSNQFLKKKSVSIRLNALQDKRGHRHTLEKWAGSCQEPFQLNEQCIHCGFAFFQAARKQPFMPATLAEVASCKTPTKATPYFHLASN